ncbi:hypothetical protein B0H34DRAFT_795986 [Crassisporium funariophilum]|nr:hypothetical protein B0H34DRAFT_795986 [Crassisporium funariophilum]
MAKNAKRAVPKHGKPITDFFQPARPPNAAQDIQLSQAQSKTLGKTVSQSDASENAENASTKAMVLSDAPKVSIKSPTKAGNRETSDSAGSSSARKSTTASINRALLAPPATSIHSLKRTRSPDLQRPTSVRPHAHVKPPTERTKSPERLKSKFGSDSDMETTNSTIYVNSTPNPKSRKKARHSLIDESSQQSSNSLIPSSQSDEEELESMQTVSTAVKAKAIDWRKQALPHEHEEDETGVQMPMDVDPIPRTILPTTPISASQSEQLRTPPLTGHQSMPPTPVALNPTTKTAQIIAQIKARAYAQIVSSPEPAALEFDDELEESSDEEAILPAVPLASKVLTSFGSDIASGSGGVGRVTRYSLRKRPSSSSPTVALSSVKTSRHPSSKRSPSSAKESDKGSRVKRKDASAAHDPFEALLKEKRLAQKRGDGDDAFHRAETTTSNFGKGGLIDEMNIEESNTSDWHYQDAAAFAVKNRDWLISRPLTPDMSRTSSEDLNLGEEDKQKLFGEDGGKAIMGILEHDQVSKKEEEMKEKVVGSLKIGKFLETAQPSVFFELQYNVKVCSLLSLFAHTFITAYFIPDFSRAALLLDLDLLSTIESTEQPPMLQFLCDLALSPLPTPLSLPAFRALRNYWSSIPTRTSSCLSLSQILLAIRRLGADSSVLASQGWSVDDATYVAKVAVRDRDSVIRRLTLLVDACARSGRLQMDELPDLVLALLLVGIDPSTSPDLQRDIIHAVDVACHCIPQGSTNVEAALCSKVLKCIDMYEPINKAHLLSLLSYGTGSTKRIASYIAYCIVTNRKSVRAENYTDLPPLSDILEELTSYAPNHSINSGFFALHDGTDYVDLGYYISMLATALSNVRGYVVEERRSSKNKTPSLGRSQSPTKLGEKPKTELLLLHSELEALHSSISDSKALHLERSRTKAILKGLSMYIHYQRDYWLKNDPEAHSKKLNHYFKKAS